MPNLSNPSALVEMFARAQLAGINATTAEQAQVAADVQTLVQLVQAIRQEATGSFPQCVNLDALDRRINSITRPQPGC